MSRHFILCVLAVSLSAASQAQTGGAVGSSALAIGSERFPIRVTTLGLYQSYESEEGEITQTTLPISVAVPVARNLALSLRASYAMADGDIVSGGGLGSVQAPTGGALGSVSGLADAQLAVSYYRPIGAGSFVASATINVPSGQSSLSAAEARTALLLGQGFYGFQLTSFGQGLNVAPALTWAIPLGDRLAAGLGIAYQVRGAFEPRDAADGAEATEYDPGDELLLTAGLDYRLGRRSSGGRFSLDGTYALYGNDMYGEAEFQSGGAVTITAQWVGTLGRHEARALARFRSRGESAMPEVQGIVIGDDAVIPTSGRLRSQLRFQLGNRLHLGALVQGRYYAASDLFAEKVAVDAGLRPEFEVARGLRVLLRSSVTAGDITGFSIGGGLAWTL